MWKGEGEEFCEHLLNSSCSSTCYLRYQWYLCTLWTLASIITWYQYSVSQMPKQCELTSSIVCDYWTIVMRFNKFQFGYKRWCTRCVSSFCILSDCDCSNVTQGKQMAMPGIVNEYDNNTHTNPDSNIVLSGHMYSIQLPHLRECALSTVQGDVP